MQNDMVGVLGFEPRTSSLSGTRSNQLSYTPGWHPLANGRLSALRPLEPPAFALLRRGKLALTPAPLGSPFGNRHFPGAPLSVSPCGGLAVVLLTSSMVLLRIAPAQRRLPLVELTGIEPATYSLQSYRSSQLSYSPGRRSYPVFCIVSINSGSFWTSCCSNSESCDATLQRLLSATSGRLSVRSLAITRSLAADREVRDRFAP